MFFLLRYVVRYTDRPIFRSTNLVTNRLPLNFFPRCVVTGYWHGTSSMTSTLKKSIRAYYFSSSYMMDAATNENVFEHNEESFLFQNFQTIIIFIITRFGKSKQSVWKYSGSSLCAWNKFLYSPISLYLFTICCINWINYVVLY